MNEIKCPECGSSIRMDEDKYSNIIKQVRDQQFEDDISKRLELLEKDKQKSIDIAVQNIRLQMQEASFLNEKKVQTLQSQVLAADSEKSMAVNKIKYALEKERDSLSYLLEKTKENNEYDKKIAVSNAITELKEGYANIKNNLEKVELQKDLSERSIRMKYENQLKERDDVIETISSEEDIKKKL